tara:strand:- start:1690 stop:1887 length:198 start_codon:yes stop_codon:yes gene_type:complete
MAKMEERKIAMFGPKPKVEKGKKVKAPKPAKAPEAKAEEKKEEAGTGKNIKELFGRDTGFTNTPQ